VPELSGAGATFRAVLFTDLVDSTALASSVGAESWDSIRRAHIETLRAAIAATGGREVKTIGDAVMAAFTSAAAALEAAVRMQVGVARDNRRSPVALRMRVGVSAGDVVEEDGDLHGEAVVEAARLCGAATGDQILVADVIRMLAGSRSTHALSPVGELDLKGLPGPIVASEVHWASDAETDRLPLPPAIARSPSAALVGRDEEYGGVERVWKQVATGDSGLVLVSGEPGIGKTRLAADVCRRAHDDGAVVLWGRCDDGLGAPYRPWVEAIEHLVCHGDPVVLARWIGARSPYLARLTPDLAEVIDIGRPPAVDPETERVRMFDAVVHLFAAVAADQPAILVLDDVHWADGPSLQLLRHVARGAPAGLLIVATYRDTDLDRAHPLAEALAELRRERIGTRVALRGLDSDGTGDLVAAWAGHDADRAFVDALHGETEGNPFFVEEVLQHLIESGAVRQVGDRWQLGVPLEELGIPEGVKEAIGRRLARIDEPTVDVLRVAAVLGRDFSVDVVSRASGREEEDVLRALEVATAVRLVSEVPGAFGRFGFVHALVRATLVDELSTIRRVRLHRAVAEALEIIAPDDVAAIAYHYTEAAVAGLARTAGSWAWRASVQAAVGLSFDEAEAWALRGLEILDGEGSALDDLRVDLLVQQALAAAFRSDVTHHLDVVSRAAALARELGDHQRIVQVAASALALVTMFPDPLYVDLAEEALAYRDLPPSYDRAALLLRYGGSQAQLGAADRGLDLVARAEDEMARLLARDEEPVEDRASPSRWDEGLRTSLLLPGSREVREMFLVAKSVALLGRGRLSERLTVLDQMDPIPEDDDHRAVSGALPFRLMFELAVALEGGDRSRYLAALDQLDPAVDELHQPGAIVQPWRYRAVLEVADGHFDAAERMIEDGYGSMTGDDPTAGLARLLLLVWMAAERGESTRQAGDLWEMAPVLHGQGAGAILAWYGSRTGDRSGTAAVLDEFLPAGPDGGTVDRVPLNWSESAVRSCLAELVALEGDERRAASLFESLEPFGGTIVEWYATVGITGAGDRLRGMLASVLGRHDEALELLEAGEALERDFGSPVLAVRTAYWIAHALVCRDGPGDRDEACRRLEAVTDEADRLGMIGVLDDARALRLRVD
jgi:class 3 adenylate cyclase